MRMFCEMCLFLSILISFLIQSSTALVAFEEMMQQSVKDEIAPVETKFEDVRKFVNRHDERFEEYSRRWEKWKGVPKTEDPKPASSSL